MTSYKVKVKWGKETYPDVELDTSEPPEVFRAQVFALTGVQTTRQKILLKGSTLKPDTWDGAKLKDGALVVVMGSRDEDVLQEPAKPAAFVEDLSESQANMAFDMPVGIKNLGNTCYLNAVVQCMKTVPELRRAILDYTPAGSSSSNSSAMLLNTIKACYKTMDDGNTPVPLLLVEIFRATFPRFAEQGSQGGYMQQDASECWTELLHLLQDNLPAHEPQNTSQFFRASLVQQFMTGSVESVWTCTEDGAGPPTITVGDFQQLSCHISTDVKYLHTGLLARLTETVSKHSALLGRDAEFTKKTRLTRLPAYLTIDMVRFYYKEKEAVNAKILKDVKFPLVLDVMDLCSPALQRRLSPYREHYKDMEERDKEAARMRRAGKPMDQDAPKVKTIPYHFPNDVGSCNSGFYQLQAVLTHQGRTSSSGHYVAWVRFRDHWLKCDDEDVTPITEDEILKLSGGGDWHCAYVLLYGPRPLTVLEDVTIVAVEEEEVPEADKTQKKQPEKMES